MLITNPKTTKVATIIEFLLVPREREQDREELKKMIAEVNRTELPPEEVLSDHLYLYCSRERGYSNRMTSLCGICFPGDVAP